MSTRGQLVAAAAETWIDVPFCWQQRVRAGCDCKGLIAGIAAELGFAEAASLEALAGDYGDKVPVRRLKIGLAAVFDPVAERQAGDVLLVRYHGLPQHLAIAAPRPGAPDRVIEAMPGDLARVRPSHWPGRRVDSIWRWREPALPPFPGAKPVPTFAGRAA